MKKYTIGTVINDKWAIVSILETKKQNKKVLAFNLENNSLKEVWIWDLTRDIASDKPNRKMYCKGFIGLEAISFETIDSVLDEHWELSNSCYFKHNYITREEYGYLTALREGSYVNINALLKKFDWLLYKPEKNNTEKLEVAGAKNSKKLARLIQLTYTILNYRKYFE